MPATSSHGTRTDVILETGGRKQRELGIVYIKRLEVSRTKLFVLCPLAVSCVSVFGRVGDTKK